MSIEQKAGLSIVIRQNWDHVLFFLILCYVECSKVFICCLLLYQKLSQSFWKFIPVKTLAKPVFRPQGLQYCGDRWGLQAQCPNSHPGFNIDVSHSPTHHLSCSTIQCYSGHSGLLFRRCVYWQANNTNLTLIWTAIHVDLLLVTILYSF